MAEIVGTITNLSDFLSKTQVCLSVKPNDPQQQNICLEADRKYSIPAFQREVRWDDNNLKMLLYDLSRSSKFLGNIILTIKSDHTCEIIDGQQRTTVLMLIVSCIKKKFGTKISTPDLCPLRNEGFTGFQTLLEKAFDQEAITSDDWNAILKSDDYLQLAVFLRLNLLDALCLTVSRRRSLWTAHPMKLMKRFATYIASMNWMRFWPQTRESLPKSKTPKESVEHPVHLAICVPGKVTLTQFGPS